MKSHPAQSAKRPHGFTVAELLVAMVVTSIVLSAVGALSFAVGIASRSTRNMNEVQIQLRAAMMHLHDTIHYARIGWAVPTGAAVWKADENADNLINGQELAYIELVSLGGGLQKLQIVTFPGETLTVAVADIVDGTARTTLAASTNARVITVLPECYSATVTHAGPAFLNVTFQLSEDGVATTYRLGASTAASADHIIGTDGELLSGDDD